MGTNKSAWLFYLLGAVLTLGWKLIRYCRHEKARNVPVRQLMREWFLEPTKENALSWLTTIAVVWAFGSAYIGRVNILQSEFLKSIPVNDSFAFLFGTMMEIWAPNAAKFILSKLPAADSPTQLTTADPTKPAGAQPAADPSKPPIEGGPDL